LKIAFGAIGDEMLGYVSQGYTNPGRQVVRSSKCCSMAPNLCGFSECTVALCSRIVALCRPSGF